MAPIKRPPSFRAPARIIRLPKASKKRLVRKIKKQQKPIKSAKGKKKLLKYGKPTLLPVHTFVYQFLQLMGGKQVDGFMPTELSLKHDCLISVLFDKIHGSALVRVRLKGKTDVSMTKELAGFTFYYGKGNPVSKRAFLEVSDPHPSLKLEDEMKIVVTKFKKVFSGLYQRYRGKKRLVITDEQREESLMDPEIFFLGTPQQTKQ